MKQRKYIVRLDADHVSIRSRPTPWLWISPVIFLAFAIFRVVAAGSLVDGAITFVVIAVIAGVSLLRSPAAESIVFSRARVQDARRSILGRWTRQAFATTEVQRLRREIRSAGDQSYPVLTFTRNGRDWDKFPGITYTDSEAVLNACRALGIDVYRPVDPAAAMLKDIEERGWWQNPLKPDR
jgi:hypothetical protein